MNEPIVIKLNRANDPALKAFMEAFKAETSAHPFLGFMRIWQNKVCFEVSPFDGAIWLSCIQTIDSKQGDGSKALDWFKSLAITHGVMLHGNIKPVGKDGLNRKALRDWYKRHGFRVRQNGDLEFNADARK